jgi:hypothetical protein
MNFNFGNRVTSHARSRTHHSRTSFHFPFTVPRDYLARRRMFRNISNVLMIVFLSLLIAGVIVYTSDPTSFSFLRH